MSAIRKVLDWLKEKGFVEKYNPYHYPAGSSKGGQFAPKEWAGGEGKDKVIHVPYKGTRIEQKAGFQPMEKKESTKKVSLIAKEEWPALKGTEKQVKWAKNLRSNILSKLKDSYEEDSVPFVGGLATREKNREATLGLHNDLTKENHAGFWIDNRSMLQGRDSAIRAGYATPDAHSETVSKIRQHIEKWHKEYDARKKLRPGPRLSTSERMAWTDAIDNRS